MQPFALARVAERPSAVFAFYNDRGESENRIRSSKVIQIVDLPIDGNQRYQIWHSAVCKLLNMIV